MQVQAHFTLTAEIHGFPYNSHDSRIEHEANIKEYTSRSLRKNTRHVSRWRYFSNFIDCSKGLIDRTGEF